MSAGFLMIAAALAAGSRTHVVVVGGLGGGTPYDERFAAQAEEVAAMGRALTDPSAVHVLSGPRATRRAIEAAFAAVAREAAPSDRVVVAWIGHGNVDGATYKFNVPGTDATCADLVGWLDGTPARRQLVILATSASGACLAPLARDGRVVVSATRSGSERNAPVFGRYFVQALRDPAADRDRDEDVTALEAFRYAEQKVQRFYATEKRLATEHPVLSSESARDFVLARRGQAARPLPEGSEAAALVARKEGLEEEVRSLRGRKTSLAADEYWSELERVLLELARVQEAIEAASSGGPS